METDIMKLVIVLMTMFQIAEGITLFAVGFFVLLLMVLGAGLLMRNVPGAE